MSVHKRFHPKNAHARAAALAAYVTALAGFDRVTLETGWAKVVSEQTYWVWPNPGVIAAACRNCRPPDRVPSDDARRRQHALSMADEYVCRYAKTSHVWKLAQREGWAGPLAGYVRAAAWVQAQLICRTDGVGWDGTLAAGLGDFSSSQEAFAAYRETVRGPVERGRVRVTVPPGRVRVWKAAAEKAGRDAGTDRTAER